MKHVRETQVKSRVNTSKTLLDETVGWMYVGGKTMCETRDKTRDETSNEMCKRKMKDVPKPTSGIHSKWQIVTLAPTELLYFSEEKKHPRHCCLQ
jgi:hypothetical protein